MRAADSSDEHSRQAGVVKTEQDICNFLLLFFADRSLPENSNPNCS